MRFSSSLQYVWLSRELSENPNQQPKNADSSGYRLHRSASYFWPHTAFRLTSPTSWAWISDFLLRSLTPDWPTSFVLSSGLASSRGRSYLCGLRAKIDKGRSSRHSGAASKMPEIILPATYNTHRSIHTYAHTSIYKLECSLLCHTESGIRWLIFLEY